MGNERIQAPRADAHDSADAEKSRPQAKPASSSNDHAAVRGRGGLGAESVGDVPLTHARVLNLQRAIGNRAVLQLLQRKGKLSQPDDAHEQEAERVAGRVMTEPNHAAIQTARPNTATESARAETVNAVTPLLQRETAPAAEQSEQGVEHAAAGGGVDADDYLESRLDDIGGGSPLPDNVRAFMEPQFGADFSRVRVHTDGDAARMSEDLNAHAFTTGQDIYYGKGKTPGVDEMTAHELTHVIQQTGGARTQQITELSGEQVGRKPIQRDLARSQPAGHGIFEVGMLTQQGAGNTPPTQSGLQGTIRFVPNLTAPNSNSIVLIQIVKITDLSGADADIASVGTLQAPRGKVGQSGVRTEDDLLRGIEGGFATDVEHQPLAGGPAAAFGSPLSMRYGYDPSGSPQIPGFKRSNDPSDVRSVALYDFPGSIGTDANFDFSFETVARSEDTGIVYGGILWGFGLRNGVVVNERLTAEATQTATFDEALARHREFYVHEPVTFYFEHDSAILNASEAARIDEFLPYLARNTDVKVSLAGYADTRGGATVRNSDLSLRRTQAVEAALLAKGIAAGRIDPLIIGLGASTDATTDAGTGDQPGGTAAVGADQSREANRRFNRRVVLTFNH